VLGGVTQILGDHGAVIHLVEGFAQAQGNAQGGAGFARSWRAIEVEDAATLLRLTRAEVPDSVQFVADLQGSQAGQDVGLHDRMEYRLVEVVTRLRKHQVTDWGCLRFRIAATSARVAMVFDGDGIVWQFDFKLSMQIP
jgi:hypothetical protein